MKLIKRIKQKLFGSINRLLLKNKDFTIISNNCWGGIIYQKYNIPYKSPTVGMYFFSEDYIKFLEKLDYYLSLELKFINFNESKHYDTLSKSKYDYSNTVIGVLDDIELIFLHYKNKCEAQEKWNRRKQRINYSKLIIKFNDQNEFSEELFERFKKLEYENKIFFTANPKYKSDFTIFFKEYQNDGKIADDIKSYKKYFKVTKFLNEID